MTSTELAVVACFSIFCLTAFAIVRYIVNARREVELADLFALEAKSRREYETSLRDFYANRDEMRALLQQRASAPVELPVPEDHVNPVGELESATDVEKTA